MPRGDSRPGSALMRGPLEIWGIGRPGWDWLMGGVPMDW
jgi:hypothetical protein